MLLRTDLPDYRRSDDEDLARALHGHDPLALAEAYHRTVPAAHACARRLLSSVVEVEALLRAVYGRLWDAPPNGDEPLEGWIRARCFELGTAHLRASGRAPASPSLTMLLPDLPAPDVRYLDAAERALAELDDRDRYALLLAHDCGVPSPAQEDGDATAALERALAALAGVEPGHADSDDEAVREDPCQDVELLGDWTLGLVEPAHAARVAVQLASRPGCAARSRILRRGRRRLEGLPPTPDMGQRILVTLLAERSGGPAGPVVGTREENLATAPADDVTPPGAGEDSTEDLSDVRAALTADEPVHDAAPAPPARLAPQQTAPDQTAPRQTPPQQTPPQQTPPQQTPPQQTPPQQTPPQQTGAEQTPADTETGEFESGEFESDAFESDEFESDALRVPADVEGPAGWDSDTAAFDVEDTSTQHYDDGDFAGAEDDEPRGVLRFLLYALVLFAGTVLGLLIGYLFVFFLP